MHSYNNAYTYKLFRLLKLSNINFVANPLVNIHLQGRFDNYPKRRGITRVKELLDAELNVCFGHDDIFDPWYPLGTGNMLQVLHMGIHACQLMGYEQIVNSIDLITTNSAKTMHISNQYGMEEGKPANLIVLSATDEYDAVRCQATVRYSIRNGTIISETQPSETTLYINNEKENIDFQK
jgi:cytosine deaminase